ncbi:MAG: DNA alkylation repair protein [Anaerolineae bacterium]
MVSSFAADFNTFVRSGAKTEHEGQSHSETDHVEYRISVPKMRAFVKNWLATHPQLSQAEWLFTLDTLYAGDSLEERSAAGMLLKHHKAYRQQLSLEHVEQWLAQLHGWKEVDANCQTVFSPAEMFKRWAEWETFLRRLAASPDLNQQRASLVLLVDVVRSSDDARGIKLAVDLMESLHHERDKRISKAVSWVLREAVKRHRGAVEQYLAAHQPHLPNATVREVQTKLKTGKKRV